MVLHPFYSSSPVAATTSDTSKGEGGGTAGVGAVADVTFDWMIGIDVWGRRGGGHACVVGEVGGSVRGFSSSLSLREHTGSLS